MLIEQYVKLHCDLNKKCQSTEKSATQTLYLIVLMWLIHAYHVWVASAKNADQKGDYWWCHDEMPMSYYTTCTPLFAVYLFPKEAPCI